MCDAVTAITVGLKVATIMQEHKSAKAIAKGQQRANDQTRKNSNAAYLNDLSKIDSETVSATREKAAETFRLNQENNREEASALNLNAGNATKVVQDIAGAYDMQFLDVTRDYEADIFKLAGQETDAYAAQARRYNSIRPVTMPDKTGALLQVATLGVGTYQKYIDSKPSPDITGTEGSP